MDGFPLVVKRQHFRRLRHHIIRLLGTEPGRNASNTDFDESCVKVPATLGALSGGSECPGFHTMMGRGGLNTPPPRLRVADVHRSCQKSLMAAARSLAPIPAGLCTVEWTEFNILNFIRRAKGRHNLIFFGSEQDRLQVGSAPRPLPAWTESGRRTGGA